MDLPELFWPTIRFAVAASVIMVASLTNKYKMCKRRSSLPHSIGSQTAESWQKNGSGLVSRPYQPLQNMRNWISDPLS